MSKRVVMTFFLDGFFYVFGLSDNPIKKIHSELKFYDDQNGIADSWRKVGMDIKSTFYESTSTFQK